MQVKQQKTKKPRRGVFNEHDTFVRDIFKQKRWSRKLFKLAFSPGVFQTMDFTNMKSSAGEAVSYEQSTLYIDLFYTLKLQNEEYANACVILEHASTPKEDQLINIDEKTDAIKRERGRNIVVFSLLFHQGPGKWPHPIQLADYLDLPREIRDIIQSRSSAWRVTLFDLGGINPEELDTCLTMRAILYTMKNIRSPDFIKNIHLVAKWLKDSDKYVIRCIHKYILTYLGQSVEELDALLEECGELNNTELGERTMKVIELLREQGREAGMEHGLEVGIEQEINTIRKLINHGVDLDTILKSTALSRERLRKEGILLG